VESSNLLTYGRLRTLNLKVKEGEVNLSTLLKQLKPLVGENWVMFRIPSVFFFLSLLLQNKLVSAAALPASERFASFSKVMKEDEKATPVSGTLCFLSFLFGYSCLSWFVL
jgi:hypothetical protein